MTWILMKNKFPMFYVELQSDWRTW